MSCLNVCVAIFAILIISTYTTQPNAIKPVNIGSHQTFFQIPASHHNLGVIADCIGNKSEVYVSRSTHETEFISIILDNPDEYECDDVVLDCFEMYNIGGSFTSRIITSYSDLPTNAVPIKDADRNITP